MKTWLKLNWRRLAKALIAATKAGVKAWKTTVILLLAVVLVGCSTTTTTVREYGPKGQVIRQTTITGDVEAAAVAGHKIIANEAIKEIKDMATSFEVPTYNAKGEQITMRFKVVDSSAYKAMAQLADLSGYESQGLKVTKAMCGLATKALRPGFTFLGYREITRNGTGATNITNVKDSLNGNQQSTLGVDSVGINSDVTSATVDQSRPHTENITTTVGEEEEGE